MRKLFLSLLLVLVFCGFFGAKTAYANIEPRGPALPEAQITTSTQPSAKKPKPAPITPKTPEATVNPETAGGKLVLVTLQDQTLRYFQDTTLVGEFKISSGLKGTPSPTGEFDILQKKPLVTYKGRNYYFPNTKWNLMFKKGALGNLYIHGAYWHHNFGHPMSHGCINVAYSDMEGLYNWANVGTKVVIQ